MALNEGELVCLLGRNGVGKSTTLKSIMGLVKPSEGSVPSRAGAERLGPFDRPLERATSPRTGDLPSLTVHENLIWRQDRQEHSRGKQLEHRKNLRKVPQAEGAAQQQGGASLRRRAADAHGGAHPLGKPPAHPGRRAHGGPCTPDRDGGAGDDGGRAGLRGHGAHGGAELQGIHQGGRPLLHQGKGKCVRGDTDALLAAEEIRQKYLEV